MYCDTGSFNSFSPTSYLDVIVLEAIGQAGELTLRNLGRPERPPAGGHRAGFPSGHANSDRCGGGEEGGEPPPGGPLGRVRGAAAAAGEGRPPRHPPGGEREGAERGEGDGGHDGELHWSGWRQRRAGEL